MERQHVWLGPEATSFDEPCEACLAAREALEVETYVVHGTLRARRGRRLHDVPRAATGS